MSMNNKQREHAMHAACAAVEFDRRHDCAARDRAMVELSGIAGYWRQGRRTIRMIRMPAGRSVEWSSKRFAAAEAWAQASLD